MGSQKETLMVASGFFVFNVAPIHWCEQIKTKNTGLRGKAGVSMLGLNQFFGKRRKNNIEVVIYLRKRA
ncbi:MAG: hypothetical protein EBS09_03980 [Flavobacteriia bacterium]|nr:hypothetical protein [Flavobacteriia bacterium]